jgi:hypothetical protein
VNDTTPATAVATVFAPVNPPAGPRPVIAWEHGGTGVLQKCMPSLFSAPRIPALDRIVRAGWVIVATDYFIRQLTCSSIMIWRLFTSWAKQLRRPISRGAAVRVFGNVVNQKPRQSGHRSVPESRRRAIRLAQGPVLSCEELGSCVGDYGTIG